MMEETRAIAEVRIARIRAANEMMAGSQQTAFFDTRMKQR
jgi:hypothetical protein